MSFLRNQKESGKAIVELAMLLPFLVTLSLSAAEIYKAFEYHQFMSVVSREIGNHAVRSCSAMPTRAATEDCFLKVVNNVMTNAVPPGSPVSKSKIIVRLFNYPIPDVAASSSAEFVREPVSYPTKISKFTSAAVGSLRSFNDKKKQVISTEVYLVEPTLIPFMSGEYYETTLF